MKPHIFAQMVNEIRDLAMRCSATGSFRDRAAEVLGKYVSVEHESPEGLLPCPFCGGVPKLESGLGTGGGSFGVRCSGTLLDGTPCYIEQVPSMCKESTIRRWNTRAP